ncbi:cysteine-rich receptor-like protein kinase 8 [Tanacetum coccineum]
MQHELLVKITAALLDAKSVTLSVQERVKDSQRTVVNYRAWRRAIEIGLSTKQKLGFIKGTVPRSATDANQAELWDTCNNMVICWLIGFVNESIARSIMFIGTTSEIWNQLEKSFALNDGSRNKQKEEHRLFQFLNGLDEHYGNQRSQILMINPLPSVENACSMLQQEESRRVLFGSSSVEATASSSKGKFQEKCSICGFKWHPPEKCWEKVGYPSWHPKYKVSKQFKPRDGQTRGQGQVRTDAHVESGNISFTPQQFEKLLRSFQIKSVAVEDDTEFAHEFAAGIACLSTQLDLLELLENGIYDTGATDHMTPIEKDILDPYMLQIKPQIKLPNGNTSVISHVGNIRLNNGILLKDVLVVHSCKFSLLSVPKLTQDSQCVVSFYPQFCMVQELVTKKGAPLSLMLPRESTLPAIAVQALLKAVVHKFSLSAIGDLSPANKTGNDAYALWHHRLCHVSDSKLKHMNDLPIFLSKYHNAECLSCPTAKFAKLPYTQSDSHSTEVFGLIYIDIWGPYKVATRDKFKYFLTIVDDCSRATWTYLLVHKSDSFVALKAFIKFVHTQFNKSVKVVRSDNALEFVKGECGSYLQTQVPSYSHLRLFGCFAIGSNPSRIPNKFSPRDATFYEHIFPFSTRSVSQFLSPLPTTLPCQTTSQAYDDFTVPLPIEPQSVEPIIQNNSPVPNFVSSPAFISKNTETTSTFVEQPPPPFIPSRRSSRQTTLPTKLKDFVLTHTPKANQKHGIDYTETFALVAKMVTLRSLLVVAALKGWDTCQMDVLNAFLHRDLLEEVYMKVPFGYAGKGERVNADSQLDKSLVFKLKKSLYGLKQAPRQWFSKLSSALVPFGYVQSKTDYSSEVYSCLVSKSSQRIFISQHKYTMELLKEGGVLNHKTYKLPMDPNIKLHAYVGSHLADHEVHRSTYAGCKAFAEVFVESSRSRNSISKRLSCGIESLFVLEIQKQTVVSRSSASAEAEYKAIALTSCEVTWLVSLFKDLGIKDLQPVNLFYDNQAALYITANPIFHARTKHIEVDCHYVRDQMKAGLINPSYVDTK